MPPKASAKPTAKPNTGKDDSIQIAQLKKQDTEKLIQTGIKQRTEVLIAKAKENAVRELQLKLATPETLTKCGLLIIEYERKLEFLESTLSSGVQLQLNEVARAGDILTKSGPTLKECRNQFSKVLDMTESAKGSLGDFSSIRSLYTARQNIRVTLEQVEHYNSIPDKVKQLKNILQTDLHKFKLVYHELVKLENWRDRVMNIVKAQMDKLRADDLHRQSEDADDDVGASKQNKTLGEQMKVIEIMANRFNVVSEAVQYFKKKMWKVLYVAFEFGHQDPVVLVSVLEIIELRDGSNLRKLEKAKEKAIEEEEDPDDVEDAWMHSYWRREAEIELDKGITYRGDSYYRNLTHMMPKEIDEEDDENDEHDDDDDDKPAKPFKPLYDVTKTLDCGNLILGELGFIKEKIVNCFPPSYDIFNRYCKAYIQSTTNALEFIINDSQLTQADILKLIKWLNYFDEELKILGGPAPVYLNDVSKKLQNRFYEGVGNQMKSWIQNLSNLGEEEENNFLFNESGSLITTNPEDALNLVRQQIFYGKDFLSGQDLADLVIICVSTLKSFQDHQSHRLKVSWKIMSLELICAILNDNQRFQETFEQIPSEMANDLPDHVCESLEQQLAVYIKGFVEVANDAVEALINNIFNDIKDLFAYESDGLFTKVWEENPADVSSGAALNTIIKTIDDYLGDVKKWVDGDYYFSKIIRGIFEKLISDWRDALFTPRKKGFQNMQNVSKAIAGDKEAIFKFFGQEALLSLLKKSGIGIKNFDDLITYLQLFDALSEFFEAKTLIGYHQETKSDYLLREAKISIDTLIASDSIKLEGVIALVALRTDLQRSERNTLNNLLNKMASQTPAEIEASRVLAAKALATKKGISTTGGMGGGGGKKEDDGGMDFESFLSAPITPAVKKK